MSESLLKLFLVEGLSAHMKFHIYQHCTAYGFSLTKALIFSLYPHLKKDPTFLTTWQALNKQVLEKFQHSHRYISIDHPFYPQSLKKIYDPPLFLIYSGDLSLVATKSLAIVGAREATSYSYSVLKSLLPALIKRKVTIISGLARGIDTAVHKQTIGLGGQTIGIIGNGLKKYYPKENQALQNEIAENHLILSEYPNQTAPIRAQFPERNRLIAGISQATLVIEAKERSSSLITAQLALEYGRDVYAVPGSILFDTHRGCHQLIQDGAKCIDQATDILNELF